MLQMPSGNSRNGFDWQSFCMKQDTFWQDQKQEKKKPIELQNDTAESLSLTWIPNMEKIWKTSIPGT